MNVLNWIREEKRKSDNGCLWYICPNPIPSKKVYAMAIVEMCHAFGKDLSVALVVPNTPNVYNMCNEYGLEQNFDIMTVPNFIKSKNQFLHFVKEFFFGFASLLLVKMNIAEIIYTRSEVVAFVFSRFYKTIYEGHNFYPKMAKINKFLLRRCHRIIVINKNLKKAYAGFYPKEKILVAPSGVRLERFVNG